MASSKDEGKQKYERSFRYRETTLNGRHARKVEYEVLTPATGEFAAVLRESPDISTEVICNSATFDDGRWKLRYGLNETALALNCYLFPVQASWESKAGQGRHTVSEIDVLSPTSRTLLVRRKVTHVFGVEDWSGWGWSDVISIKDLQANPEIDSKNQFIIRIELEEFANSVEHSYIASPELDFQGILDAVSCMSSSKHDVRFIFGDKVLYGHACLLQNRCTYLKTLLTSDFNEAMVTDYPTAMVGRTGGNSTHDTTNSSMDDDSDYEDDNPDQRTYTSDSLASQKMKTVHVTDFALTTFEAFLFYLHTGVVSFRTLRSSLDGGEKAADKPAAVKHRAVSPKSIYRIADKYDVPALKEVARVRIVASLTPENVLVEISQHFTSMFPAFIQAYQDYALQHWQAVSKSAGLAQALENLFDREDTRAACVTILQSLDGPGDKKE